MSPDATRRLHTRSSDKERFEDGRNGDWGRRLLSVCTTFSTDEQIGRPALAHNRRKEISTSSTTTPPASSSSNESAFHPLSLPPLSIQDGCSTAASCLPAARIHEASGTDAIEGFFDVSLSARKTKFWSAVLIETPSD